jgi:hypothetical protein
MLQSGCRGQLSGKSRMLEPEPPWHESLENKNLLVARCYFDVAYRRMGATELENDQHALRDSMKPAAPVCPCLGYRLVVIDHASCPMPPETSGVSGKLDRVCCRQRDSDRAVSWLNPAASKPVRRQACY